MLARARYVSSCVRCTRPISVGAVIDYDAAVGTICESCSRLIADAKHAAYQRGMDLLRSFGVRSGLVWDHSILDGAADFGIAAQFYDDGKLITVNRWKLEGGHGIPLSVQTVHIGQGRRLEYLWGPKATIKAVSPRAPAAAPAKAPVQRPVEEPKAVVKGNGAPPRASSKPQAAQGPVPSPVQVQVVVEPLQKPMIKGNLAVPQVSSRTHPVPSHVQDPVPSHVPVEIVVEPLPKLTDDEKFKTPVKPPPELQDGLVINLDRPSGLFHCQLPVDADAARGAIKGAGFRFHWGLGMAEGDKRCHGKCEACAARLPDHVWFTRDTRVAKRFVRYLSPEARQAAEGSLSAFEQSRASTAEIEVPAPKGMNYFGYQLAGIKWCLNRSSVLLADDCGVGKTIQMLGVINANDQLRRVLVICPASLTLNWRDEAKRWLVRPTTIEVLTDSRDLVKAERILAITNYEMLIRHRGHHLHGALLGNSWDLIAVDEAHRLCNQRDAATAQAVLGVPPKRQLNNTTTLGVPGLLSRGIRRILATGTPFRNRPRELWPLVHALDPNHFDSEARFLMRYCGGAEEKKGRRKFDGKSHLEELQDRLRSKSNAGKGLMIRRLKADVLPDLPDKIRQIIALPIPTGAAKLVNFELREYERNRGDIDAAIAHADMLALRGLHIEYGSAVASLHAAGKIAFNKMAKIRHEVGFAKAPVVVEHVSSMLDGGVECVIVFAHHHDVVQTLMEGLAQYNPVKITGNETKTEKHAAVAKFQTDTTCRVIVANIAAAGEGITLSRSSNVVFCELSFVPGQMTQCEDRSHRIGQKSSVLVQHLVFDGSVDQRMAEILVEKTGMAEAALDVAKVDEEFPSRKLQEAAEQRMNNQYSDEVRAAAVKACSLVPNWKPCWEPVARWLLAQPTFSSWQCDIALRFLKHHAQHVPESLSAIMGLGADDKKKKKAA